MDWIYLTFTNEMHEKIGESKQEAGAWVDFVCVRLNERDSARCFFFLMLNCSVDSHDEQIFFLLLFTKIYILYDYRIITFNSYCIKYIYSVWNERVFSRKWESEWLLFLYVWCISRSSSISRLYIYSQCERVFWVNEYCSILQKLHLN